MFRIKPRLIAALTLTALSVFALGGAPVSAAAPRTLIVAADGHARDGNCAASNTAYSTIQAAINGAHAGDTIKVCPGDYTENLVIGTDDLSIVSTGPWTARIWRPTSLPGLTPLVDILPGADGVLFQHFALMFPTTNACDNPTSAAILAQGTNAIIRGNRIRTDGVDSGFYSCGYQIGIVVGPEGPTSASLLSARAKVSPAIAPPSSALVGWNLIRDFQFAGVLAGGPNTAVTTMRNSIHFGHRGATSCAPVTAALRMLGHRVTPAGLEVCFAFGIIYIDGVHGGIRGNVVVSDFVLTPAAGTRGVPAPEAPLLFYGIAQGVFGPAGSVTISDNTVAFAVAGIGSDSTGSSYILNNAVSFTLEYGIGIEHGTGATVKQNTTDESSPGLWADSDTSGNLFRNNTVTNGGCVDDSTGGNTAGTANHWVNNTADTSSPLGICVTTAP